MNGVQSTSDSGGVQPGDSSDAERPQKRDRRYLVDAVFRSASLLRQVVQETQDGDLTRALEKIDAWLSRE